MMLLRNLLLIVSLSMSIAICRADVNTIQINSQQIENLGIQMGKLAPASNVPIFSAPAHVTVPASHDYVVSSTQPGLVVKMLATIGDKVSKGDVLAIINSPDLLTLQGNYLKAISALKLAQATYLRDKKLLKEGVVSGRNEQESYNVYNAAVVEAKQANQLLQIAGVGKRDIRNLESSGKLSSQITIYAPASGHVIERMVVTGSRVDGLSPLYRIANLSELWLEINVPQEHISDLHLGDSVIVEDGLSEAVIKVLGQNVNPDNQTVTVRALLTSNTGSLRVGQKITVQAIQANDQATFSVPDSAIAHNEGKTYVFVRTKDGFSVKPVMLLGKSDANSIISGDLSGDEDIAIDNAVTLKANWLGLGSDE
jgi:cobalt-zinc-cadmium efflux system membrane fusion protein